MDHLQVTIRRTESTAVIQLLPTTTSVRVIAPVELVADYDGLGAIIGIEVLHVGSNLGVRDAGACLVHPAIRFDPATDAMYLAIQDSGRGLDNKLMSGAFWVDDKCRLCAVEIPLECERYVRHTRHST